jgi:hypothetical protein
MRTPAATRTRDLDDLSGERHGPRPDQRLSQAGEHHEVSRPAHPCGEARSTKPS